MNKIGILAIILFTTCNSQTKYVNEDIEEAKWYFYCYASELKAYDKNGTELNPLSCEAFFRKEVSKGSDTTVLFFSMFNGDTSNICSFKPYDIVGVLRIKNKYYLPEYHVTAFEPMTENMILSIMKKQYHFFEKQISNSRDSISNWIKQYRIKRK